MTWPNSLTLANCAAVLSNAIVYTRLIVSERKSRKEARELADQIMKKKGEQALQFEMMWKDYKERKNINGGQWHGQKYSEL